MKKIVCVVLAALMLCSSVLMASASLQWSIIDSTYANATRTIVEADLGTRQKTSLKITAQLYRYSSVADDYMRSVKFEESASNSMDLGLFEYYNLSQNDKVVFTFNAGGEIYVETCYVY